jgi:hypothetical protein
MLAETAQTNTARRTQQMRASKSNHSILQKRFREDDGQEKNLKTATEEKATRING